jgi:hypothetical protein
VLSVRFALAALKNEEFDVACVPGYALRSSRFAMIATLSFTGASGLSEGESSSSNSPPGGVQRVMSQPMGM